MMFNFSTKSSLLLSGFFLFVASSCSTPKDVAYVQDLNPGVYTTASNPTQGAIRVRPDDRLAVIVTSRDPTLSSIFNLTNPNSNSGNNMSNVSSAPNMRMSSSSNNGNLFYTVDPQGYIDMPVLGKVHVGGLTRSEIADKVKSELVNRDLLRDPTVVVEFGNPVISVLGAVNSPGRFSLDRDHVTLFDGIAMAGDLSMLGKRTNVTIIREITPEQHSVYVVDLTKGSDVYSSPAYYLQQNDVIIVEPIDTAKRQRNPNGNVFQTVSFWMSVASFLMSAAVVITNVTK